MTKRTRDESPGLPEPLAKKQATRTEDSSPTTDPPKAKTLLCPHPGCDKTFSRPSRLSIHERSHTGERPYKCTYDGCKKSYMEEKHLTQHITDTHTGERRYLCDEDGCPAAFSTATRLRRHLSTVHSKDKAGVTCSGYAPCTASFRKKSALERHIRKDHQGLPAYLCPEKYCDAAYDSAGALRNHKTRDHGELKFWCEVCGQDGEGARVGFSIASQLQLHMRKEHLNCLFCDFTSSSKHDLARHVEMQHTDRTESREPLRIQCEWEGCEKWFTKRSNLNVHIRSAHEGKRFVCGEIDVKNLAGWNMAKGCGKGFASKANLEDHVRYVHLKIARPANNRGSRGATARLEPLDEISGASDAAKRNLECPVAGCDFKFIRNHDLRQHVETYLHAGLPDSGGLQAGDQEMGGAGVDPVQSFAHPEAFYTDGTYGSFDINADNPFPDPDVQYAAQDPMFTQDAQPATADAFSTAMENAELAQQFAADDDLLVPGWNNAQGMLVEA